MHGFHDNFIKKHFNAELLFTDTGRLTYVIKSDDDNEETNFLSTNICLILETFKKILLTRLTKKSLVK